MKQEIERLPLLEAVFRMIEEALQKSKELEEDPVKGINGSRPDIMTSRRGGFSACGGGGCPQGRILTPTETKLDELSHEIFTLHKLLLKQTQFSPEEQMGITQRLEELRVRFPGSLLGMLSRSFE